MTRILLIQTSPRKDSVSHRLADRLVARLQSLHPHAELVVRDLPASNLPYVNENIISSIFTPPEQRTPQQMTDVALSDALVGELKDHSDYLVIACPMYNFGPPAVLKSWVDMVARTGLTFKYRADGSGVDGLAGDRPTYIVMASGSVAPNSEGDFLTTWLRYALGFMGIKSVEVIAAAGTSLPNAADVIAAAEAQIDAINA